MTTIIGSTRSATKDLEAAWELAEEAGSNVNVLHVPQSEWSWKRNIEWLGSAVRRGDDIYLATDPKAAIPDSYFYKEIQYLKSLGYEQQGYYMVKVR